MTVAAPVRRAAPALGHRPGLDGVRALAVGLVLLHHVVLPGMTPDWLEHGMAFIGVDVFFVLSGFLITRLLLDEVGRNDRIALGRFWARRALRLLPLAVATVAVVMVLYSIDHGFFLREGSGASPWRDALAALAYHMNLLQLSAAQHHNWALTHTWSLSIEEQFYVVWPAMLAVAVRRRPAAAPRIVFFGSLLIVVASGIERYVLSDPGHADYVYNSLESRAGQLCAGAALAGATLLWPQMVARIGRLGWFALAGLLLVGLRDVFTPKASLLYDKVSVLSVVLIAAACEFGATHGLATILRRPLLQWIGKRSYALYLVHYPVMMALTRESTGWGRTSVIAARLVISFAVAELAHRFIERPTAALRTRHRIFAPA